MDAKVISPFYDLEHPERTYRVGDTFSGSAARVGDLAEKGFVEKVTQQRRRRSTKKEA